MLANWSFASFFDPTAAEGLAVEGLGMNDVNQFGVSLVGLLELALPECQWRMHLPCVVTVMSDP